MGTPRIEILTCPAGDWTVVMYNGSVDYEGHSLPLFYLTDLIQSLGAKVTTREISDEFMQEGKYYEE